MVAVDVDRKWNEPTGSKTSIMVSGSFSTWSYRWKVCARKVIWLKGRTVDISVKGQRGNQLKLATIDSSSFSFSYFAFFFFYHFLPTELFPGANFPLHHGVLSTDRSKIYFLFFTSAFNHLTRIFTFLIHKECCRYSLILRYSRTSSHKCSYQIRIELTLAEYNSFVIFFFPSVPRSHIICAIITLHSFLSFVALSNVCLFNFSSIHHGATLQARNYLISANTTGKWIQ